MKRTLTLLTILCLLLAQKSDAQLEKGNILVGADLAHFDIGLRKNSGYNINLTPSAAWFIADNIAVGPYINFGIGKANKESATSTDYGIGVFGRYYVNKPNMNLLKQGRWFGTANVGFQGANVSDGGGSTNGLGLGFGPGYAYFITPNIGLETVLRYEGVIGFGDLVTQSFLTLNFGFQIYLPGKATLNKVKSTEGL